VTSITNVKHNYELVKKRKDKNAIKFGKSDAKMDKALKDFKTILDIKMGKIPPTFQALDDAFLPGFNVDKAFVGHLYMYCKNEKSPSDVIKKLKALNDASNGGLNAVGDRLTSTCLKKSNASA